MTENIEVKQETISSEKKCSSLPTVLAIVFFAALVVSAYFNYKWYKNEQTLTEVTEDLKSAKTKVATMGNNNRQLEKEVSLLKRSKGVVTDSLSFVMESNKAKDVHISRLNKENVTLKVIKTEIDKINDINLNLESSNKKLKEVRDNINKAILDKQTENNSFKNRLK